MQVKSACAAAAAAMISLSGGDSRANVAQVRTEGGAYSPLVPQADTSVRVDEETLTFDLSQSLGNARVTAAYKMTNTSSVEDRGEAAFVYVGGEERREKQDQKKASISIDGADVAYRVVHAKASEKPGWAHFPGGDDRELTWLVFPLVLAPGAQRSVVVEYQHEPAHDYGAHVNDTVTYEYLLSPAKKWASFGKLDVRVRLPADAVLTSSSPTLVRDREGAHFSSDHLPDGELTFELTSTAGTWFGMTHHTGYWVIQTLLVAAAEIAAASWLGRRFGRARSRVRSVLLSIFAGGLVCFGVGLLLAIALGAAFPPRALGFGYDGLAGTTLLLFLATIASIIVAVRRSA